jgi:peptide/nickel transport system substrate-binding protein
MFVVGAYVSIWRAEEAGERPIRGAPNAERAPSTHCLEGSPAAEYWIQRRGMTGRNTTRGGLMRTRLLGGIAVAVLLVAASCSQGSTDSGGVKKGGILKVGTVDYIDSLNPFIAIESQSYNAFVMLYPQLVQYGPGIKIEGDWATSWSHSDDGLKWTFELEPGTKWSDGEPMTASDAAWTGNTIIKYADGPTSAQSAALSNIKKFSAPDPTTLVIEYESPIGNVLAQLEQFWILPQHVWSKYTGNEGKDIKTFQPEQDLPVVAGGAYTIDKYEKKGTTVFKPNPNFYGPESNTEAVALIYYTNSTSMIADLRAGTLDWIESVPPNAVESLKSEAGVTVDSSLGPQVDNITFNVNPVKPQNRELLDPKVREALEYATNRQQLIDVVYNGYAKPWANLISSQSGDWVNPDVQPLPYDPDKANEILDSLGYEMRGDVRWAPATSGQYAQPAHPMSYKVIVPGSLNYNGDRAFEVIRDNWAKVGVELTQQPGGDTGQAYALETAGGYTEFDLAIWDWVGYVDPDFMLSVLTKGQWYSWSDTGYNDPAYDAMYEKQSKLVDQEARRKLVWKMQEIIAEQRPYINTVQEEIIMAWRDEWTGFYPQLGAYCKCYYTSPHLTQ